MLLFELSRSREWIKVRIDQFPIKYPMRAISLPEGSTNLVYPAIGQRQGAEVLFVGHGGWFERT